METYLEENWHWITIFFFFLLGVVYVGNVFVGQFLAPSYECGSRLNDRGLVALVEHGVSSECPDLVVDRSCNNVWLREFEKLVEEHGEDSFYGQQLRDFESLVDDPRVLSVYYSVGGDSYGVLDVFGGDFFPGAVPRGFCEEAPGLRWGELEE